jgi:tryptophanyl-tRNA synthetase
VGEDQLQHLELMREIARKWNARFREDFFPEPQPMLSVARRIVGLDGDAKMSKSLGNTVGLLDPPERIWELLRPAKTDPARVTRKDPGDPEKCNIYSLHQYFSPPETVARHQAAPPPLLIDARARRPLARPGPHPERAAELRRPSAAGPRRGRARTHDCP